VSEEEERRREEESTPQPRKITVREAVKELLDMPQDAVLAICGHEFPGDDFTGWYVQAFEATDDQSFVLVEGAAPLSVGD
jgi:hypothetical protein